MKTATAKPSRAPRVSLTFHGRTLQGFSLFSARIGSASLGYYRTNSKGREARQNAREYYAQEAKREGF